MNFKRNLRQNLKTSKGKRNFSEESKKNYDNNPLIVNNYLEDSPEKDEKIKSEARELIEKTKKMMEELSVSKAPLNLSNRTSKEKNLSSSLYESTTNQTTLQQKLLLKSKQVKLLEKELKEKTQQLKIAQEKLQQKNSEISKLNEALTIERSNNLKVENIKLQRKVCSLEKANEENKKLYERLIEDYKNKINTLSQINSSNENKMTQYENNNLDLSEEIDKLKQSLREKDETISRMNEQGNNDKRIKERNQIEIDDLKLNLSNLIVLVKTLYSKECQHRKQVQSTVDKFNTVFNSSNNNNFSMLSTSDYGYNRQNELGNMSLMNSGY